MVEKVVQPGEELLKQLASIKEHLLKIVERAKEAKVPAGYNVCAHMVNAWPHQKKKQIIKNKLNLL